MKEVKKTFGSTHELLTAEGYAPEQALQIRARVSVSENGKRYLLDTNGNEESVVYALDGNIVKEGQRCDKLVLVKRSAEDVKPEQWTEAFVELKGVDTNHAIDQLRQTLKKDLFKHPSNDDIRARIVAQSFPSNKSNPAMGEETGWPRLAAMGDETGQPSTAATGNKNGWLDGLLPL